ncbi:MAG: MFS transporter, partial [Planctomycetota bacterium]|nr:MFS transporter [Planctomycetota bacterium]
MLLLAGMYLGYAALYMCRATVVIAGPAMLDDPELGLTKTAWGAIIGWGTAGTLIGKLANGVLADKLGGRRVFLLSLGLCMLATATFGTMSGVLYFSVGYFMALFAKSAAWPSMANLISVWYPKNWRGRIWGILSSSSRLSSLFTTLVLGSLLLTVSWRGVIATSVVIAGAVLSLVFFVLKQSPADVGLRVVASRDGDHQKRPHPLDGATLTEALLGVARSPRVWLLCVSIMCLTVLME